MFNLNGLKAKGTEAQRFFHEVVVRKDNVE